MSRATTRYLIAWTLAAITAVAVLIVVFDAGDFELRTAATLLGFMALSEIIVIRVNVGRAGVAFTLGEAGIVAGLLLVAPVHVIAVVVVTTATVHLPRRLSFEKVWFNVAQVTVATTGGAITMLVVPPFGPTVGTRSIGTAMLAMITYATINTLAFRGLVRRIGGERARDAFDEQTPLTLAAMFGTVAIGVVAAQLYLTQPLLIVLLLVPLLAIQIAARASLRAEALVGTLRAERDRLEQVVLGASDGILLLDGSANVQIWSPEVHRLSGIAPEQAAGRPVAELLTPRVRDGSEPVSGRWVMQDGSRSRVRHDARWKDGHGRIRDVQEDHALLFDEHGQCSGDVVLVRDVSRERALERLRSDFVARVSHELRTPLTPIRGYVQLLLRRRDTLDDGQRVEALEHVLDQTERLAELVEDLLLVTQLERGGLDGIVDREPIRPQDLVERTVAGLAQRHPGRRIELRTRRQIPPAMADAARVRQIITALVDNAVRYSPASSPVVVVLDADESDVEIRVLDRGPGIPPDVRNRVFEAFERLEDPLLMRTTGVGLGLYIVQRLTQAMQGSVTIDDQVGGGSVLIVRLPRAAPDERLDHDTGADPPPVS